MVLGALGCELVALGDEELGERLVRVRVTVRVRGGGGARAWG